MIYRILFILFIFNNFAFSQQTKVFGVVKDASTGEPMPFIQVFFQNSKIGTETDTIGRYVLESYYATDSLVFSAPGYLKKTVAVQLDLPQEINVLLSLKFEEIDVVVIRPPDEFPSTILHKKVIANKHINNKEKLDSYEYELYNKVQLDIDNVGGNVIDKNLIDKFDVLTQYIDSTTEKPLLPAILSESISQYYFKNNPKKKREIVKASYISGISTLQLNQFLGDMYVDINVYENSIPLFNQSFISPLANYARNFYRFYLEDSAFIDSKWCYKLTFKPKRSSDLTFQGVMWIHDTTYAVKSIEARVSPGSNMNYVQDFYFEQKFNMVAKEVWMMTYEKILADIHLTKNSKINGIIGRKTSSRKFFAINETRPTEFYNSNFTVEVSDSANLRSEDYWITHRHIPLEIKEQGINEMIDTLNNLPLFSTFKKITYLATTSYYPIGKIEIGKINSLYSRNPIEKNRFSLAIRTSNNFSKRVEFGVKVAYGLLDEKFKYGASVKYNVTPKKRGVLTAFYNFDIEQIGQSPTASTVGSTFGTLFRTGPLNKLTFVERIGINFEKDIKKDIVLYAGFERKDYTPLGLANYLRYNTNTQSLDTIRKITSSEFIARFRWTKDEEFIAGTFDRSTLNSRYPIFSLQGIFAVKGFLGGNYNYQKIEFRMDHNTKIPILGRINYGVNCGYIFGTVAYPFLKVHEGNQSYWLLTSTFNMLNYFEFISDKYVGGYVENHWGGLFFDAIPYVKNFKLRVVSTGRITYGAISNRHEREMEIPSFTKSFGKIPYAECSVGLENIFKVIRIDVFYRISHLDSGMNPFGIRGRFSFNF
ncbi:MAG: carboxypeptidase-like regulatory domain-containing protein [Flavobacteriia bacterium]|nr:carboxypeptidase-like regulatory domain-containing protein [Flavobacteriia bacterium]